jgi:hypothetical protein
VTNARAIAVDEFLLLQWDDLDVRDLTYYEVRIGSTWAAGQVVHRERTPRALLGNPPGGGTALIAARSSSGIYGNPVALELPAWSPRNTDQEFTEDDLDPPAGTHSGTQFNADGYIELVAGALTGTYTSVAQDATYQAPFYWQVQVDRLEHEDATGLELQFTLGSGEARWWTGQGRPASPCAPGADWQTHASDIALTLDDLRRHPEFLGRGHVGEVGSHTRVLIESRFEFNGAWGDWKEHADRTVVAQKMQVRLTLERRAARYSARVTGLKYSAFI